MNRLIAYTAAGLFLFWYVSSSMFGEKIAVNWEDIHLQTGELVTSFRNLSAQPLENYGVTAKIFDENEKLLETAFQKISSPVSPNEKSSVKFPLTRVLVQGKAFQIKTYIQKGSAPIVAKEWKDVPVFNLQMKANKPGKVGEIEEIRSLKKPIQTIDIKKAMGIF